jgi:transcriptional regulator with XRE-family HTH domain
MENETLTETTQKTVAELIKEIGEKITDYRWAKRIKVPDIALLAGVSEPLIRDLENGRTKTISLPNLISIANAVGYKIDEIKIIKID